MRFFIIILFVFLPFISANAQCICTNAGENTAVANCQHCVDEGGSCACVSGQGNNSTPSSGEPVTLDNPLGNNASTINQLIGKIISAILGIVGSLALLMFVYGGLTWMTAAGAPDKVQKGKDIIIWAVIGLVIIFMSYAMVSFVLNNVIGAAG